MTGAFIDIPVKPQTIDEVLWLLAIITIIILSGLVAYLFKKMISRLDEALNDVIKLTVQMQMVLEQLKVIPELQKDVANIGAKLRSSNGTMS
jgi:predicted transport protein